MKIYYVAGLPYSDELYHHGIKGQKWGIRRFENPDGTLTEEGKKRYANAFEKNKIDDAISKNVEKSGNKLINSDAYLKKKYGSYDRVKNGKKLIEDAKNVGANYRDYERNLDRKIAYRERNKQSINLGFRIQNGQKYAEQGYTKGKLILEGVGNTIFYSALTGLGASVALDRGNDFIASLMLYAGGLKVLNDAANTAVKVHEVSEYEKYLRSKS